MERLILGMIPYQSPAKLAATMSKAKMVTVIAHVRAKQGQEERAREILEELVAPTRGEAGCINYDLHQSAEDPGLFVFYENWTSAAALDAHANSEHIVRFRNKCSEVLAEGPLISKWQRLP
jgi:quinol monooxygenase YgiN